MDSCQNLDLRSQAFALVKLLGRGPLWGKLRGHSLAHREASQSWHQPSGSVPWVPALNLNPESRHCVWVPYRPV